MFIRVRKTPRMAPLLDVCIFDDQRHVLAHFSHLTALQAHQQFVYFLATISSWPLIEGEDPDDQPLTIVNGG